MPSPSNYLNIYEEETNLFWGLVILVCTAGGTFLLADSFVTVQWDFTGFSQLFALLLFVISFIGIFKLAEPLYHFTFYVEGETLFIDVKKGEQDIKTITVSLTQIEAMKFAPYYPRSSGEALFDFSTSYHIMWKAENKGDYKKLIDLGQESFTLKVEDIAKIIRFIQSHNTRIRVAEEQTDLFSP